MTPASVKARATRATFARNELAFDDPVGCDHERLGPGLRKAVYNYMHGVGLEADVRSWFAEEARGKRKRRLPAPEVPRDFIKTALARRG